MTPVPFLKTTLEMRREELTKLFSQKVTKIRSGDILIDQAFKSLALLSPGLRIECTDAQRTP